MLVAIWLLLLAFVRADDRTDWTLLDDGTTGGPGFRLGHRAVYCSMLDSMVQFGGFQLNLTDGKYYTRGDLHMFDFLNSTGSNSSWFEVNAVNPPSPRAWFSMSSLPSVQAGTCQAVVFGGTPQYNTLISAIPQEDYVWLLTVFENRSAIWENVLTENNGPEPRFLASSIVRSVDGTVVVFGGTTPGNHTLRDMWTLNLTSKQWSELSPASNLLIEPRYSHSMTYDEETDTMYVYGGRAHDNNNNTTTTTKRIVYNMAQYSFAPNAWLVNVDITLARAQANLFIVNRTLLSFGGMTADHTNAFAYNDLVAASLSGDTQCLKFWCAAVDVESRIFPRARFDYGHVLRHTNLLVVTGGRFAQGMADVWQLNLTSAMRDQNFAVLDNGMFLDPLQLGNLYESMYFLVAVLMFLTVCYWIFTYTVARTFYFSQQQTAAWENQLARARAAAPRGMTPEAIAVLPMRKLTISAAGEMCSICLNEFTLGEQVRELPCHHVFHAACVDEWLQNKNSCPLCKQQVDDSVGPPPIEGNTVVAASNVAPEDGQRV